MGKLVVGGAAGCEQCRRTPVRPPAVAFALCRVNSGNYPRRMRRSRPLTPPAAEPQAQYGLTSVIVSVRLRAPYFLCVVQCIQCGNVLEKC